MALAIPVISILFLLIGKYILGEVIGTNYRIMKKPMDNLNYGYSYYEDVMEVICKV